MTSSAAILLLVLVTNDHFVSILVTNLHIRTCEDLCAVRILGGNLDDVMKITDGSHYKMEKVDRLQTFSLLFVFD